MNLNIQAKERMLCIFASHIVLTKIYIFSASDLRPASKSYWNWKSLRLPNTLECSQKRWAWPGTAATKIALLSGS